MSRMIRITMVAGLVSLLTIGAALGAYWLYLEHYADTPGTNNIRVEVTIEKGWSSRKISRVLEEFGLIESARDFYLYLRFVARKAEDLRAGEYMVEGTMTPNEIIQLLQKGLRKEIRFSIPEGLSKDEIADVISASGLIDKLELVKAMDDPLLRKQLGVPSLGAWKQADISGGIEGYLYPDTYQFPKGTKAETILRRMNNRLLQKITPEMVARMDAMNWSLHQVLTLASIIEKETGRASERPQIASVFLNRLKIGMKLQTDPTVIYATESRNGKIGRKDLKFEHPYNTYTNFGLPPGPIASPGVASIHAVLWPAKTKYLYFVSRNNGSHIFCPTYTCHRQAVQAWQVDYFKKGQMAIAP